MLPHFANPAGLWALAALPLLVAIHFLHRRPREHTTATLFLLESLVPEESGGRAWERFRASRAFWLQLLAALLLAWVLAEPVWPGPGDRATAVFVLDESADMQPFRREAIAAVKSDMQACERHGLPVTWILLGSRPAGRPFYSGPNSREALSALERRWHPQALTHDPSPALGEATALAGRAGLARFITCRPERVPSGMSARCVGRPLANLGFVGITPAEEQGEGSWRIAVRNNALAAVAPQVSVRTGTEQTRQDISLPTIEPGGMAEFTYRLQPGCERAWLQLPPDEFATDNALALQRARPRRVDVLLQLPEPEASLFEKVAVSVPGLHVLRRAEPASASAPARPGTVVAVTSLVTAAAPAIVTAASATPASPSAAATFAPVIAEKNPLTDGLNWNGLLVPAPGGMLPGADADVLLWQGGVPLAWLQQNRLFLNWRWKDSNAGRIPAPLLMICRYLQSVQDAAPGTCEGNWPSGAHLPLHGKSRYTLELPDGRRREGTCDGRLPEEAGFVEISSPRAKGAPAYRGGVWWADARMGDFSSCRSEDAGLPDFEADARRRMHPDPLAPLWLCLAGLALVASWLPARTSHPRLP